MVEYIIRKENDRIYTVIKWEDEPLGEYKVTTGNKKWFCNCPNCYYRHRQCKHIAMVKGCIAKGTPQPYSVEH